MRALLLLAAAGLTGCAEFNAMPVEAPDGTPGDWYEVSCMEWMADCRETAAAVCPFGYEVKATRHKTWAMPVNLSGKPGAVSVLGGTSHEMVVRCDGDPSKSDWNY